MPLASPPPELLVIALSVIVVGPRMFSMAPNAPVFWSIVLSGIASTPEGGGSAVEDSGPVGDGQVREADGLCPRVGGDFEHPALVIPADRQLAGAGAVDFQALVNRENALGEGNGAGQPVAEHDA